MTFDFITNPTPHANYDGCHKKTGVDIWVKVYSHLLF